MLSLATLRSLGNHSEPQIRSKLRRRNKPAMTTPRISAALRRSGIGLALAAGVAAGPAFAQGQGAAPVFTTAELARACGPAAGDANALAFRSVCYAVMVAVGQTHAIYTGGRQAARPAFCLPDPSPSMEQISARFVSWVAANPQHGGTRAAEGVLRFAAATYPCAQPTAARRR